MISEDEEKLNMNNYHDKNVAILVPVNDREPHITVKRILCHRRRPNRKRNNFFRSRRYHYFMARRVYHRFTMKSTRNILHQYNIHFTRIKTVDELLVIGV
ncbi:unnamed protein product [Rotaria sp. Silwood1]|nr:unnamed protein product [Rotaria sp. Silwood1]CAF1563748.1 unnamed protein product [Rotaria sp. Silwood1]CAF3687103.1 unnamed protein product [Rotaria sp. Silwood1]CAF3722749.1 unnamed protein product [Rotaria sp. Silwood1]CAF3729544.1 unnamed protein product [Rotaria sp. Silwood1]